MDLVGETIDLGVIYNPQDEVILYACVKKDKIIL